MLMLVALAVIVGFALYVMTPEERRSAARAGLDASRRAVDAASRDRWECRPFLDALHARTPWAVVTPAILALNVTVFVFTLFGAGGLGDPETLVRWGASVGPRTTNGEWWRLVTALFVHGGVLSLLVNLAGLVQVGLLLERLVGGFAFAVVFFSTGALTSLVGLSASPVDVRCGAAGAIFGIYGLLGAALIWGLFQRSAVTPPLVAVKRLLPAMTVFVLYALSTDDVGRGAGLAGLVAGFGWGLLLARGVSDHTPPVRRVATAMATIVVLIGAFAVPLRGLADARPDLGQVVEVEERTAATYQAALTQFRKRRMTAQALIQVIDESIVPELTAARERLTALGKVPTQQHPLVANAEEYLQLREESWRLRAEGLRTSSMDVLREADRKEFASLQALRPVRAASQP